MIDTFTKYAWVKPWTLIRLAFLRVVLSDVGVTFPLSHNRFTIKSSDIETVLNGYIEIANESNRKPGRL